MLGQGSRSDLRGTTLVHHIVYRGKDIQSLPRVLTYGTETWVNKAGNLHSLERASIGW